MKVNRGNKMVREMKIENNNNNKQRGNKMVRDKIGIKNRDKQIFPYGITPPKTIEEFRENLKKYYLCVEDSEGEVYLELCEKMIPIDKIQSLYNLYNHCEKEMKGGYYKNEFGNTSPSLTPLISIKKELGDYMKETNQSFSSYGFFFDEDNFTLYKDKEDMITEDMKWWKIDNQWLREFFMITMGEFSGYVFREGDTYNESCFGKGMV